ncbi:NAD-dependent epimerase/dehydratase family protein, partial [bacterium]|nr:NAD-dependent epimerase/dehydratase family protein [bacterium]
MKKVIITGSEGFIGKNLCQFLQQDDELEIFRFDITDSEEELDKILPIVDCIVHLAGVNRPEKVSEFETGNHGLTAKICDKLQALDRKPEFILSSSIQA